MMGVAVSWKPSVTRWVLLAAVSTLVVASCCALMDPAAEWAFTGHFCSAAEEQFAARLLKDPMLVTAPEGMTRQHEEHFQPCVGDSSNYDGGATVYWAYSDPDSQRSSLDAWYRGVGERNGWKMGIQRVISSLCGSKTIDGTPVAFSLDLTDNRRSEDDINRKEGISVDGICPRNWWAILGLNQ